MESAGISPVFSNIVKLVSHIFLGLVSIIAAIAAASFITAQIAPNIIALNVEQLSTLKAAINITLTAVFYMAFVRFYEKRAATELAFAGRRMLYGALLGFAMLAVPTLMLFALGNYQVVSDQGMGEMLFVVIGISAIAISEEFIFRAIVFRVMERYIGTLYALLFVCFLSIGLTALSGDGIGFNALFSTALISALWCSIYILTRNIWVVALHHAAWNYAEFSSGILDEHWRTNAPIISRAEGPQILTGGAFGPEASILTMILCAASLLYLYRLLQKLPATATGKLTGQTVLNTTNW